MMGFIFGLVKKLIKYALVLLVLVAVIILIPNLPPYTKFTSIKIEPLLPLEGPLTVNRDLNNVEKLYKDKLLGPEAFQMYSGEIYTSLATGEIVKISPGGHVTFVTKIGQPCSGVTQPHKCGRPLGFQIDEKTKQLYVADAYLGIWKVDMASDKKQLLVSPRVEIEGRVPKIFNSLALAKNGDFYWTDSSSDFLLKDGVYTTLADPSGRLFFYNAKNNQSKVLLDDLWFANGVVMSPDNQFVLVTETMRMRILKYYIDGPRKGKSELFVAGLPGMPDNMRALPDGSGVLVALCTAFDATHPLLERSLSEAPLARKLLARLQRLVEIPFEFANDYYPNAVLEDIVYHIGHFQSISSLLPGMAALLQIDWNGNIVASYYHTDGSMLISDAIVYNDKLLTGSPHANYIGAVPAPPLLKKAFASVKAVPLPKTAETVTKKIPNPKLEAKPQQAKPMEVPKQKVQEKPKVEEKQERKIEKLATQQAPKTSPPLKTVEGKAATPESTTPTPKRETKLTTSTTNQDKKPPTPNQEKKPTTLKPEAKSTSKPEPVKSTTPAPIKTQPPQTTTPNSATKSEQRDVKKTVDKKIPELIPITENIPVDTAKPNKERLKVIKKDGPTEIPHPNMTARNGTSHRKTSRASARHREISRDSETVE